ncbi:hypothetical protein DPMN_137941 [Dreissena polymorpha]|uniref:Uncharacterized protein n=1 Tax=Dreissena polymorpha TaxID=45954 RepID=A0A9D4JI46_DREPO|nr:hypothetical protein DPMN_137941 [Dreissena polymorpha]
MPKDGIRRRDNQIIKGTCQRTDVLTCGYEEINQSQKISMVLATECRKWVHQC